MPPAYPLIAYRAGVTGPHVIPFLPSYIPPQVCATVGKDPATPPDACMDLVLADVREDGVSASASQNEAGLAGVVADAKQKGVDLKIVVLDRNPPIDTPLRDIATCLLYTSPSPRDGLLSRMPSSA